ncbi:MAG: NUDIX domain-containing protein [Anaerolineae bacterium]|jgi:8-oxo-dGTP pyrophosphatase MutT (NUDIX family)|nr:NUDIX domain-containing protein [Anaerolineae bacterium]MBT7989932.1 NUDIX domain-containing protein [Anaerolineae bacterium]
MKRLFLKPIHFTYFRVRRVFKPISIGVRVLLIQDNKVLMVKHSYQDGWFLVGGGAKQRENLADAARREAMEEAGATLGEMKLFGIYTKIAYRHTDHIAVFLCKDFTYTGNGDWEIDAIELFSLDTLPENTAPGIRRRIEDYLAGVKPEEGFGEW